jgi:hypothetical protein
MNATLKAVLKKYGTERVIARIMEQQRLLAQSENEEVLCRTKKFINSLKSDTEYIYALCEYTNFVSFTSRNPKLNTNRWNDICSELELLLEMEDEL